MANYNLGFFDDENSTLVNLTNILDSKKLEDLDSFTSQFKDEYDLMNYLLDTNLITQEQFNEKLRVIYKSNNEIKRTGIVYNDSIEYIDLESLKYRLHSLSGDINFLEELIERYKNANLVPVDGLKLCLNKSISSNEKYKIINSFYEDVVFRMGKYYYKGLRSLALFIYNYELKMKLKKTKKAITGDNAESEEKGSVLSSAGDPDFPPNSEEEKRYNEYMELQGKNADRKRDVYDYFYKHKTK